MLIGRIATKRIALPKRPREATPAVHPVANRAERRGAVDEHPWSRGLWGSFLPDRRAD